MTSRTLLEQLDDKFFIGCSDLYNAFEEVFD